MVGRLDDSLKVLAERENIAIDPDTWSGPEWRCSKRRIRIFQERGYRIRLLSAAFRNHMHWSEFIGGDVVISPPYSWQLRYNASDIEPSANGQPVDPEIIQEMTRKFADFHRAYTENGSLSEFDCLAPTRRTLRQFISACHDLDGLVRDVLIPNPDVI